jgi:hypothetical protein
MGELLYIASWIELILLRSAEGGRGRAGPRQPGTYESITTHACFRCREGGIDLRVFDAAIHISK